MPRICPAVIRDSDLKYKLCSRTKHDFIVYKNDSNQELGLEYDSHLLPLKHHLLKCILDIIHLHKRWPVNDTSHQDYTRSLQQLSQVHSSGLEVYEIFL